MWQFRDTEQHSAFGAAACAKGSIKANTSPQNERYHEKQSSALGEDTRLLLADNLILTLIS